MPPSYYSRTNEISRTCKKTHEMRHHEQYHTSNCSWKKKRPRINYMNNLNKWTDMTDIDRTCEDGEEWRRLVNKSTSAATINSDHADGPHDFVTRLWVEKSRQSRNNYTLSFSRKVKSRLRVCYVESTNESGDCDLCPYLIFPAIVGLFVFLCCLYHAI